MKCTHSLLIGTLAVAVSAAGAAGAQGIAPTADTARIAKVQLHNTSSGKILVNASGLTLYMFSHDTRNKDTCVKVSGCSAVWPAMTTSGKPRAGAGVKASKLSTITLPGGAKQVTYYGHPLYLFGGDLTVADPSYLGTPEFGGTWDGLTASGHEVK